MDKKGLFKVSLKDGKKPIEVLDTSMDKAKKQYAKYYAIPVSDVISYDYCRIYPKGMI